MSSAPDLTSRVLRRDRAIVVAAIALLALLGWRFVATGAGFNSGDMMAMHEPSFGALLVMWWVMMVAMMLPSATPAILLYARVREIRGGDSTVAQTWVFLSGYLAAWLLFSIVAAAAQRLSTDPSMVLQNRYAQAGVLLAAGIYELSPLKEACLGRCRSPAQFLSRHWRPGWAGAIRLGILHGADCVGCCWLLMALLFVGGVMNLLWIVALTLLVTAEKLVRRGEWLGRSAGVALIVWGALRLAA